MSQSQQSQPSHCKRNLAIAVVTLLVIAGVVAYQMLVVKPAKVQERKKLTDDAALYAAVFGKTQDEVRAILGAPETESMTSDGLAWRHNDFFSQNQNLIVRFDLSNHVDKLLVVGNGVFREIKD